MRAVAILAGMTVCLVAAGRAEALPVVFERLPANPFQAGTFFSDVDHPREATTFFSLGSSASIASITWWGGYSGLGSVPSGATSEFVIRLYAENGHGGPGLLPFYEVAVSPTVTDIGGIVRSFRFAASLPTELEIPGGVPLWLAIVDVDPARPTFAWRKSTEAWFSYSRSDLGYGWNAAQGLGSFRLESTAVPEPGTAALTLLGLSALGFRYRRRLPDTPHVSRGCC